jgi:putative MATE family efflux protein
LFKHLARRIFSTQYLIKQEERLGDIPPTKEAYKTTLAIAAPAVAEMVFMTLIGMADTMMVGVLGSAAIAAVGLTMQPRMLFMSLFFALNAGVTAIVSRRKGAEDRNGANVCLAQSLLMTGILSILMAIVSTWLATPAMRLIGAKEDTILYSSAYFKIISTWLPIQALTLSITAAQRGIGNTKISLKISLASNIVNVIFNYLLIGGRFGFPRLEVRGAAIATIIGSAAGLIVAIISLLPQKSYLSFTQIKKLTPHWPTIRLISKIGGNAVFEQICLRVGFLLYARVVAELGTFAFSAHQIASQMLALTFTIADGLSVASSSLIGQNLGRKRPDVSIIFGKISQRIAFCISVFMIGVILSLRYVFAGLYTKDPQLIQLVADLLIIMTIIQPLQTSHVVMAGSLRGAGDTRYVAMTMLMTVSLCRPLFSVLLVHVFHLGLEGAWFALLFDQGIRCALLYKRFVGGRWTAIKI